LTGSHPSCVLVARVRLVKPVFACGCLREPVKGAAVTYNNDEELLSRFGGEKIMQVGRVV
jgi:hypothetical protein